jgi:hypothetical protein
MSLFVSPNIGKLRRLGERRHMPATILIVEDHDDVCRVLRKWPEPEFPQGVGLFCLTFKSGR